MIGYITKFEIHLEHFSSGHSRPRQNPEPRGGACAPLRADDTQAGVALPPPAAALLHDIQPLLCPGKYLL